MEKSLVLRLIASLIATGFLLVFTLSPIMAKPSHPDNQPTRSAQALTSTTTSMPCLTSTAVPGSILGVESTDWGDTPVSTVAGCLASTGGPWTRYSEIQWSVVQPTQTASLNFSSYDSTLSTIAADGLTPIVVLGDTPSWAALDPVNAPSGAINPTDLAAFVSFVQAAVKRYSVSDRKSVV